MDREEKTNVAIDKQCTYMIVSQSMRDVGYILLHAKERSKRGYVGERGIWRGREGGRKE